MQNTIKGKLITGGIFVLLFMALMIISSQVVVGLFKNTSNKLVIEYNELDAIEELKMSLGNLLIITSGYVINGNKSDKDYFDIQLHQTEEKLIKTTSVLTELHDISILTNLGKSLTYIDSIGQEMFLIDIPENQEKANELLKILSDHINRYIIELDFTLTETKHEIDESVETNNTIIKHSTITMLTLGLIVILVLLIGGSIFIRNLTRPIKDLVMATKKISKGDRKVKVSTSSNDELSNLAQSFNEMIETLQETTVSKNYLNNILNNMFNALVVTDNKLKITSVNQATLKLLHYEEDEIIGQNLNMLFKNLVIKNPKKNRNERGLKIIINRINNEAYFISKSKKEIPIMISSTVLKMSSKTTDGLVIVAYDLTEKIATEREIEKNRKERQIALNEAQEEERMRIATDLHDGLGQMLTAISYSVQNLSISDKHANQLNPEPIIKIQNQIDATIQEAKSLAHNLIPIVLKDFGLVVAIENLINRFNELHQTKFSFNAYDFNDRINPKLEKALYRISQESLNNIVKHAKAENASFQLFRQDNIVVLVIEDDGVGFDPIEIERKKIENKSGIGLISIKERVLSFNGEFTVNSELGQGTELLIEIPCISYKH